ncbi:MAG: Txe/YoeB family addiction module toxin [Bauldia sp.]|nr:MAG: Txe/YoeB family addiction module toxin [Bauldia sp.]MBZ0230044.1 Txe/YoeB family addiction module toxin [Bauldia sp.]
MSSVKSLILAVEALDDLRYWTETDPRKASRILRLIDEVCRTPFIGTGKPELLKHLGGVWSRRIDQEHRLVYSVSGETVRVLQCRYHYTRR